MRTVIEQALGVPNGVRVVFETPVEYLPGTVRAFINGQLQLETQDVGGLAELGGKRFQLHRAPLTNDHVMVAFVPLGG